MAGEYRVSGEINAVGSVSGAISNTVISMDNYNKASNKPRINGVELVGNKTTEELNIPAVPTKLSQLTNDADYITSDDIPAVPTKTSQLENDSGFIDELTKDDVTTALGYTPPETDSTSGSPEETTAAWRNIYAGTADMAPGTTELATGTIYIFYE